MIFLVYSNERNLCFTFRNKETKSPLSNAFLRSPSFSFSTRLPPSSSSKSLPATERDIATPTLLLQSNNRTSRENMTNDIQVRSTPSSPNIIPSLMQRQMSTIKTCKEEGLTQTYGNNFEKKRVHISFC
jgi:hypothetical protein